jgi:hypothetical protein
VALEYGLFSLRQAKDAGLARREIDRRLRTGRWERSGRGLLQVAGRAPREGDEIVRAVLNGPQGAVVGFETAAALHGWDLLRPPETPQLIVPAGGREGTSLPIAADETCWMGIVPVSSPARTALDIACRGVTDDAVVAVDSALRSARVSAAELTQFFAVSRRRGIQEARQVLALADPASASVPEPQARLLFAAAGLPTPVTQLVVIIDGRILARADFGWPKGCSSSRSTGSAPVVAGMPSNTIELGRTRWSTQVGWCCGSRSRTSGCVRKWSSGRSAGPWPGSADRPVRRQTARTLARGPRKSPRIGTYLGCRANFRAV